MRFMYRKLIFRVIVSPPRKVKVGHIDSHLDLIMHDLI